MPGVSESASITTVEINNINITRTRDRSRKPAQDVSAVLQGKDERRSIRGSEKSAREEVKNQQRPQGRGASSANPGHGPA